MIFEVKLRTNIELMLQNIVMKLWIDFCIVFFFGLFFLQKKKILHLLQIKLQLIRQICLSINRHYTCTPKITHNVPKELRLDRTMPQIKWNSPTKKNLFTIFFGWHGKFFGMKVLFSIIISNHIVPKNPPSIERMSYFWAYSAAIFLKPNFCLLPKPVIKYPKQ